MSEITEKTEFKFYKLTRDGECFYVGVTSMKYLSNRLSGHKNSFKKWKNGEGRKHCYFTDDFNFDGVKIELIEKGLYDNLASTRVRENELIDEKSENQSKNRIFNSNYQKEYREKNKEKIKIQHSENYQKNKEERDRKNREYCIKNHESIRAYKTQWARDHPMDEEKIKERREKRSEKVKCSVCNIEISRGSLKRHVNRIHQV